MQNYSEGSTESIGVPDYLRPHSGENEERIIDLEGRAGIEEDGGVPARKKKWGLEIGRLLFGGEVAKEGLGTFGSVEVVNQGKMEEKRSNEVLDCVNQRIQQGSGKLETKGKKNVRSNHYGGKGEGKKRCMKILESGWCVKTYLEEQVRKGVDCDFGDSQAISRQDLDLPRRRSLGKIL